MSVTVVLDAQAGSCGKGKFIGYLAQADQMDIAINNFMSNAGHTYVTEHDTKIMTQHLPTSLINPNTTLCIGPGSAITPDILADEIYRYSDLIDGRPIVIHPRAMVIRPHHVRQEEEIIRSGSTFKGCGAAQAEKVLRHPNVMLMGEYINPVDRMVTASQARLINMVNDHKIQIMDTGYYLNTMIDEDDEVGIMIEGSQGFDLDINYGLDYPHTTSRQCHAGQLVADCGISPRLIDDIIMIMRPYPIRISNKTNIGMDISSGDYAGSPEITWDEVKRRCGAPDSVQFGEMTTVTKKVRRVFEMNWDRLKYAAMINRPTYIAINFVQYIDYDASGCTEYKALPRKVKNFINEVEKCTGVSVGLIGTGPRNDQIIDIR